VSDIKENAIGGYIMSKSRVNFDVNADKYSKWSVTTNKNYLDQFYDFAEILPNDTIIDFACGSGDFLINCADRVGKSKGIDYSGILIKIANSYIAANGIHHISFEEGDIEMAFETPAELYDVILCRMALHHFGDTSLAFANCMQYGKRVCKVAMQDIVSHGIRKVDLYFDRLERLIDRTHKEIISKSQFENLFMDNNVKIRNSIILEREIVLKEYMLHANQTDEEKEQLKILVSEGLDDPSICSYIYRKNNEVVFKRKVQLISGSTT